MSDSDADATDPNSTSDPPSGGQIEDYTGNHIQDGHVELYHI